MAPKLIFVYNADADKSSAVKDWLHKAFRPSTYPCHLCGVAFGAFGVKKDWQTFIDELEWRSEFYHRDEFKAKYPDVQGDYPCAFIDQDGDMQLFISQAEMNAVEDLEALMDLVDSKVREWKDKGIE
jgi:hypothetical protein